MKENVITLEYPRGIKNDVDRSMKLFVNKDETAENVDSLRKQFAENVDKANKIIEEYKEENPDVDVKPATTRELVVNANTTSTLAIALPLPNELTDQQSHDWETTTGIVGEVGTKITNASVDKMVSVISPSLGKITPDISINKVMGSMSNTFNYRKPLFNPGYFQNYNGSQPREFTFTWLLIPNSEEEALSIKEIILQLKRFTLPRSFAGVGLLSPYSFDIELPNPSINEMMGIIGVVCKSMNVDYAAEGGLQFLPDGMPKYIKLSMTFTERAMLTAEHYMANGGQ